jgi:glyoxylase-like metal-dependent hydrolase (beta-lactamase superfamily II)
MIKWPDILPRPANQKLKQLKSFSSWFAIYQVTAHTFAIVEPYHIEEVISYLVLGNEKAALIDTGMGIGNIRDEVDRLTDLPIIVINTHSHFDHVGDNHRFEEVWAFDEDWEISKIETGRPKEVCVKYMGPGSYLNLPKGFEPETYEIFPSKVTQRLHHLESIELGGRTLAVHHTPGHSPGSICLLDDRDNILFTGDTYYPGMIYIDLEGSDFVVFVESMTYLVGLLDQIDLLCPAHNEAHAPKEQLRSVLGACETINTGQVEFELLDKAKFYHFEGFGMRLPLMNQK